MFSRLNMPWLVLAGSVALVAGLGALLLWKDPGERTEPLIIQCAAALREPMEEIIPLFEQQKGIPIEVRYGESASILTNLRVTKQGDIFLPADDSYIADAEDLLGDVLPLAKMNAALVVNPAFGRSINTWEDLFKGETQIAIANPKAAAVSRLTKAHLDDSTWKRLSARAVEMGPVTQVANAVKNDRNITAGIIWDSMVSSPHYKDLQQVKLKELDGIAATVKIGVVKNSPRYAEALGFAQFVAIGCPDILRKHGFTVIATPVAETPKKAPTVEKNDPPKKEATSTEQPEILVYAGAMLRPAIEETINEFEKREGVRITRVYNGCGILVSQMKAGQRPDVYFSCDATFMNQVQDLFEESKVVSKNQLVIAVKKGNVHGIKSLKDLGKEGLRVGVGHEQQCALGVITEGVLIRSKTYKSVMENVKVRSPSGDLLVNQLRTGSLDAVVAYISNVKPYEDDDLEAIKVEEVNCQPSQPIAISKSTAHPDVVKRLLRSLETAQSKDRFEKLGFGWEVKP